MDDQQYPVAKQSAWWIGIFKTSAILRNDTCLLLYFIFQKRPKKQYHSGQLPRMSKEVFGFFEDLEAFNTSFPLLN